MSIELLGGILQWIIAITLFGAVILAIQIWIRDKTKRISYIRIIIQIVSFVFFYFLLFSFPWLLIILVTILVSTIFLGRFFCGWICPFGLYMDAITIFRKTLKKRYLLVPESFNRFLNKFRYVIFAVIFAIPFLIGPLHSQSFQLALFFAGPFKHWTIFLGPLETLIVPDNGAWAIYGLNLSYPYVRDIMFYSTGFFIQFNAILFVVLTFVGSFLIRRIWCRFCPLGLSFAVLNSFKGFKWLPIVHLEKSEEKCTKCGVCKRVCPTQVTEVYENKGGNVSTSMCTHCFRCVEMCPYEKCLSVNVAGKSVLSSRNWLEPAETE